MCFMYTVHSLSILKVNILLEMARYSLLNPLGTMMVKLTRFWYRSWVYNFIIKLKCDLVNLVFRLCCQQAWGKQRSYSYF